LKLKKVIPAGSLARDTILKGHLEIDCVYILGHNNYSFSDNFTEVINTLQKNHPYNIQYKKRTHSITFYHKSPIGDVSIDLLPAFEINHPMQMSMVKKKDAYYGSTTLFQKEYFINLKKIYPRFTDLVRLLKLWRNKHHIPLTSYMLELIVANSVKRTNLDEDFDVHLYNCFRTIQSFTDGYPIVPVFWEKYVDNSELVIEYSQNRLWIIDPSDPSENIAKNISEMDREFIKSEAGKAITNIRNKYYTFLYA
jgi:tRNA nucleotidyltransferase (CCA-adding enzyme)